MITFPDFVTLASDAEPTAKVQSFASAFLALSGFSGLIVTQKKPGSGAHDAVFARGYPGACIDHVCNSFIIDNPEYQRMRSNPRPSGWYSGFEHGFEASTWLLPAGYRNGSSIAVLDTHGVEIGSIHTNTRREALSDKQLDACASLRQFLRDTFSAQLAANSLNLTAREREVIGFVVQGATNAEIATALYLSRRTVATHMENILRKTNARSRVDLAVTALRLGLT